MARRPVAHLSNVPSNSNLIFASSFSWSFASCLSRALFFRAWFFSSGDKLEPHCPIVMELPLNLSIDNDCNVKRPKIPSVFPQTC